MPPITNLEIGMQNVSKQAVIQAADGSKTY